MNTITELYDKLTTGIVAFKEFDSESNGHKYRYATLNKDYIEAIDVDAMSHGAVLGLSELNLRPDDNIEGFNVVDVVNNDVFLLKPHYFTGVCQHVAYTKTPDYVNYPEALILLGQRKSHGHCEEDQEVVVLKHYGRQYADNEFDLANCKHIDIVIENANTNTPIAFKQMAIIQKNTDKGFVEDFFIINEYNEAIELSMPQAAIHAMFEGHSVAALTSDKGPDQAPVRLCMYVKDNVMAEHAERFKAAQAFTQDDMERVLNNAAPESDVLAEMLEQNQYTAIVFAERKGFMQVSHTDGVRFIAEAHEADLGNFPTFGQDVVMPAVGLFVRDEHGQYDWEFYLTQPQQDLAA
jgi:hypothetical protein